MKNIDTFVRWGIPGWTATVGFLAFVLSDFLSANDDTMYQLVSRAFASPTGFWQAILAGLLIAGTGIPLGYMIYQCYFYLRWNSPVSKDGFFPPLIVGRVAELDDTIRELDPSTLSLNTEWRRELLGDLRDHRATWQYLSPLIYEALVKLDSNGIFSTRHSNLMNIVHSLGASHLGFAVGFAFYLLTKWKLGQAELWWAVVALIIVFVSIILLSTEDRRNSGKGLTILRITIRYPGELFVGALFFLYLTLNPALNERLPYGLPLALCLALAFLWGFSVKEGRESVWGLALILTLISVGAWLTTITIFLTRINWPIVLSTLVFGMISLAFLKNRQNAREQLVILEHYLLRRYIEQRLVD